jgi:hypothetical protein
MDLTGIYRVFHTATAKYTFFSAPYGTFSKTDCILDHKAGLNKYKTIGTTCCILFVNNKRNNRKQSNNWRLNNTLLHDQQVKEKTKEDRKKFLELNENESTIYQNLWDTAKQSLGESLQP